MSLHVVVRTTLGSLSTSVFETRTATGSALFSLLTCIHTNTFTLPSIFFPLLMISIKIWETPKAWNAKCSLPVAVRVSKARLLRADLHGTIFVACYKLTTSSRQAYDMTYDCRRVLKHVLKCYDIFADVHNNRKSCRGPDVSRCRMRQKSYRVNRPLSSLLTETRTRL